MTPAPLVSFEDVEFHHPGGASILRHLSLALAPGQIVALVGRSGAGKTTLLKLVNRLLLPSAGRVMASMMLCWYCA